MSIIFDGQNYNLTRSNSEESGAATIAEDPLDVLPVYIMSELSFSV